MTITVTRTRSMVSTGPSTRLGVFSTPGDDSSPRYDGFSNTGNSRDGFSSQGKFPYRAPAATGSARIAFRIYAVGQRRDFKFGTQAGRTCIASPSIQTTNRP